MHNHLSAFLKAPGAWPAQKKLHPLSTMQSYSCISPAKIKGNYMSGVGFDFILSNIYLSVGLQAPEEMNDILIFILLWVYVSFGCKTTITDVDPINFILQVGS